MRPTLRLLAALMLLAFMHGCAQMREPFTAGMTEPNGALYEDALSD